MSVELQFDISVAVVTFNNASQISACLSSVVDDLRDFRAQIIVVDNASTDQTVSLTKKKVASFANKTHDFVVIENVKNVGFTKALNQAFEGCLGNFIVALNPDTRLISPCIPLMISSLKGDDSIGVVAPQLLNLDDSIQKSCRRFPRRMDVIYEITGLSYLFSENGRFNRWKMGDFDHTAESFVEQPQGAFLLFRSRLLSEIGPWDEGFRMFFSDVDWCLRVHKKGYKVRFLPAARAYHHQGASVHKERRKMIWTSHWSFYHYFKKHEKNILLENQFLGFILMVAACLRIMLFYLFRPLAAFASRNNLGVLNGKPYSS